MLHAVPPLVSVCLAQHKLHGGDPGLTVVGPGRRTLLLVVPREVSRRAMIAGAAGALLVTAGCSRSRATTNGVLQTRHVPFEPRWRLAVPGSGRPLGLVVALHGHGGDADSAFDDVGLGDHVDRTGLAVVSVDGGDTYWHRRRDGTDASAAMVTDDLLPVALEAAGLRDTAPLATFGWSMGGFGAMHLAADMGPSRVRAVVASSAAVWRAAGETPEGAFDDREDTSGSPSSPWSGACAIHR